MDKETLRFFLDTLLFILILQQTYAVINEAGQNPKGLSHQALFSAERIFSVELR